MVDIDYYKSVVETQHDWEIFREEMKDLIKELEQERAENIPLDKPVKPANGGQEIDCWHCKKFEQHTNQRIGYCDKHKFDSKVRIAKLIKCEDFIPR